jgi:hypothetical protein
MYSFTELDKYNLATGEEYIYTVTEDAVPGYTSVVNGTDITNTYLQPTATPTTEPTATPTTEPTATPTGNPSATATPKATTKPTAKPTSKPKATATPGNNPTAEPTKAPTPVPTKAPAPTGTPVIQPTATPVVIQTPAPDMPKRTPERTVEDTPTPEENTPEILKPSQIEESGVLGAVRGSRRGLDLAVLGRRRRPVTGDSMALLLWIMVLALAFGGNITSSIMLFFSKKTRR